MLQRCPAESRGRRRAPRASASSASSFNDAPAESRGRPRPVLAAAVQQWLLQRCPGGEPGETASAAQPLNEEQMASTMPRRRAGGDPSCRRSRCRCGSSFNDAPAESRGRRHARPRRASTATCFNDAPAESRGRRTDTEPTTILHVPLQRCPGGEPGETHLRGDREVLVVGASTMPRRRAGGDSIGPTHCFSEPDATNCERCRNIAWSAARATGAALRIVKEQCVSQ